MLGGHTTDGTIEWVRNWEHWGMVEWSRQAAWKWYLTKCLMAVGELVM